MRPHTRHNTDGSYSHFTDDRAIRERARELSAAFVANEGEFHLGFLPTEQPHPYTSDFAECMQAEPEEGIALLLQTDADIPPVARRSVLSPEYDALVAAIGAVVGSRPHDENPAPRICFSGCGSTGRLAIMLEEMWRQFWTDAGDEATADRACSIMTGGDRALIRSVENFEDYEAFGARQIADLNIGSGDVCIAISEGGETSSVIGTAREARRRRCRVFFVFNNPRSILTAKIRRSRELIEDPNVTTIDLYTGSMALAGSTRMQATTIEMLVLGIALEEALTQPSGPIAAWRLDRVDRFARLLGSLLQTRNRTTLASVAREETDIYRSDGLVTYYATDHLLDIFCDTTERSPTFMLPPFRRLGDQTAPLSWAFAKDPRFPGPDAWRTMLRRIPRGIDWSADDYRSLAAPCELVDDPPELGLQEIYRYPIGNEPIAERLHRTPHLTLLVDVEGSMEGEPIETRGVTKRLRIEATGTHEHGPSPAGGRDAEFSISIDIAASPIKLFHHLAIKLIFNTISTGSMAMLGRIRKNWMIQVDPTNKKLLDRGSRIIAQIADIGYAEACFQLFLSSEARREAAMRGIATTTSPVVDALARFERSSVS